MKTFIFADRIDTGLQMLTDNSCAALLPIAGKTVIEYTLEDLARAGIREAVIIASAHADRVEALLGKGERWGMQLDYFPSRGAEHPAMLLSRYARELEGQFLLIRGDVLRSSMVKFIENAATVTEPLTEARIHGAAVGVCLCQAGIKTLETLSWPYADCPGVTAPANPVELMDACWSALDSLPAYHRANLDVVANRYPGLKLAGWARENGLTVGRGSHVDNQSLAGEHAFVGRSTRVRPSARLAGTNVVGANCFIDSQATISDSVILPGTYVGENIEVRNAIINGNKIMRVDSGASYRVTDRFLLTQMQTQDSSLSARLANRLAGVMLLLLSLPLWPLAAGGALLKSPATPLRQLHLHSNKYRLDDAHEPVRGTFTSREWVVNAPLLQRLPLLLAVVAGHINLVGARPRPVTEEPSGSDPWEHIASDIPAGLLGPVQLDLPDEAPSEEGVLNEIYYAQYRSLQSDLGYLLKGLRAMFSGRAWAAHGQTRAS
ncbi:MAG: NDP-sugar synthase [Gammaproteobacteria bacterium]|jgi:NDP-sugar pyrophosphorylase family protein|nr:NDP-sugar synthase [Gammaproteobacteria bacterium]